MAGTTPQTSKCKACNGHGMENFMVYRNNDWEGDVDQRECHVCNGAGVIEVPPNFDPRFDLYGPAGSMAICCDTCGGRGPCNSCDGNGITGIMFTIPAPTIKPVRKRKTGKMYQRNPMLNANDSDHFRVIAPIKKEWRRRGRGYGNRLRLRTLGWQRVQIDAYVNRPIRNNSDAANFHPTMKPIMDGLIDARLLPDDNDNHLAGPYLHKGEHAPYSITIKIVRMENTP